MKKDTKDIKTKWICSKCGGPLKEGPVKAEYLGGNFEIELLECPKCKNVLITQDLAAGQMLEVEKSLEDK
ncbi:DNA-binding protein [Clostridium algoriphilum]|uniref:DVU_1557 family redox protein n=1 Tax=Clostridium algoriphilum TaxID=198347 RepID=UPI001CF51418|nr:CLJU_RS11820 family redox protein [Clostridium algoriphilum]MCB2295296.1 DNA-binding protein [Clostridium algoriphilum]